MSTAAAIVSDKQLGDVLLLQPVASWLAVKTGLPTSMFVRDAFRPLVELMPDCIIGRESERTFSEVWCTSWGSEAVWWSFRLRTPMRRLIVNKTRHTRWWYRLLFHEIRLEAIRDEYWALYFWRVVSGSTRESFQPPRLSPPPADWRPIEVPDADYVLLNPTAAWPKKYWAVSHWVQLITEMRKNAPGLRIILSGGGSPPELEHCAAIMAGCPAEVVNLAGRTGLKQYLWLLSRARMVVCIDGAASHLAQAFGVPAVTLFGPTHDGKWHWPTPHHIALASRRFTADQKFGPAAGVPVEPVWEAVSSLLRMA